MNFWEWASTMSVEQVSKTVLAFLKVLAWPVVVVLVVVMFRTELTALLQRLESLDGPGFQSKFRRTIAETVEGAEAAEEDVRQLAAAVESASNAPLPSGTAPADADESREEEPITKGPQSQSLESMALSSFRRGMQRGLDNPHRVLATAWRRLEDETKLATSKIPLGSKASAVKANPSDPVALFDYLYDVDVISEETMMTVRRAKWLSTAFGYTFRNEAYRRELIEVAGAIDSLRRSLKKISVILAGQERVQKILDEHGDETLPDV